MDKAVETHTCMHKYYSTINNEKILTFATTFMELEGIMLSEVRQRKTNTA